MNKQLFDYANRQYQLRDYPTALIAFTECLQDASAPLAPGETGLLYHQIGNCLIKLNNPTEAIQAYNWGRPPKRAWRFAKRPWTRPTPTLPRHC